MNIIRKRRKNLTVTILSLSLLTVMAGAAVAPALDVIKTYFNSTNQILVQMIISIPSLFIVFTNIIFPKLCKKFKTKELVLSGLFLYIAGGCTAGLFDNIFIVLIFRALVGIGVGIIMPMSTGLISFYYTKDNQDKLMGYSSAMNQFGGVASTIISGVLASISWRASFLVYLIGLISIVLCLGYLPNEKIIRENEKKESGVFRSNYMFIVAIFLSMFTFFVYPSVFAIETAKNGIIPHNLVAVIMAGLDFIAFFGGLSFMHIKKRAGIKTKYIAPVLFLIGYIFLLVLNGFGGAIVGSALIGFANGLEIPFIISAASQNVGKTAATTIMPMISVSMYLAQFLTPIILSLISDIFIMSVNFHLPYFIAAAASGLLLVWSLTIKEQQI